MKNMKLIKVFGLGLFLALAGACTDDLNTKPKVELSLEQLLQDEGVVPLAGINSNFC